VGASRRFAEIRAVARGPYAFEAHLTAFVAQLQAHHYSISLQRFALQVMPRLFAYLRRQGIRDLRAVTEAHLVSFAYELATTKTARGQPPALQTQNSHLNVLRRFFRFLEQGGVILRNPATDLPFHKLDVLPRDVVSQKQVEALMRAPDMTRLTGQRDRAILETLYGTAIRLSECGRLDLADLDLREETLLIRDGKGKKDRMVPVTGRAAEALDVYLRDVRPHFVRDPKEPALFLQRHGRRLSTVMIGLLVSRYGLAAGVKLSPHGLRHACATHLIQRGADIRHVQRLLGHANIQTTARYTRVALKDLRDILERAHPRELAKRRPGSRRPR
jgi:integrase/recombinase XerD